MKAYKNGAGNVFVLEGSALPQGDWTEIPVKEALEGAEAVEKARVEESRKAAEKAQKDYDTAQNKRRSAAAKAAASLGITPQEAFELFGIS